MQDERDRRILTMLWAEQKAQGLNDYRLALELGVPQSTISRMKSGERSVTTPLLFKIAEWSPTIRSFVAAELLTSRGSTSVSNKEQVA